MGNSSNTEPRRAPESRFNGLILQYMDNYGKFSGEQLRGWITENFIEQFYSVTYTKHAVPSYRKSREDLVQALNKAHESGWRARLLQITHVQNAVDREIVKYKWVINVPSAQKPGQRVDIFYDSEAVFQTASGMWVQSVHHQFVPEPQAPRENPNYAGRFFRWWGNQICNNLEHNMKATNDLLDMNARMAAESHERAKNTVEHRTVNRNGVNVHQARRYGGGWVDGY